MIACPNRARSQPGSKTYRTCCEQRQTAAVILEIVTHPVAKSLRSRRIKNPVAPVSALGTWAVDATAKELHVRLGRPDAQFEEAVISLRRQIWSALDKANEAVKPLKDIALAKQRLREALPHLDDLIALLDRSSTAHALGTLPSALRQIGEDPRGCTEALASLEKLPELRAALASVASRDVKRGSKGTPFEDAFIQELAEIWLKITGTLPPQVVKEAKTRRGIGYLFYPFVDGAFSDIQQPKLGLKKRIRRVLSARYKFLLEVSRRQ